MIHLCRVRLWYCRAKRLKSNWQLTTGKHKLELIQGHVHLRFTSYRLIDWNVLFASNLYAWGCYKRILGPFLLKFDIDIDIETQVSWLLLVKYQVFNTSFYKKSFWLSAHVILWYRDGKKWKSIDWINIWKQSINQLID